VFVGKKTKASPSPTRPWGWYATALLFAACGLMSKPMLVTLPAVLLILDFWPLNRLQIDPLTQQNQGVSTGRKSYDRLIPLLLEKIPFLVLSVLSSMMTLWAQRTGGAVRSLVEFPVSVRLQTVLVGYATYLGKTFWPKDLMLLYPHPGGWPLSTVLLAGVLLLFISVLAFAGRRRRPYLLAGWIWYLVMLIPVIGLVQVGAQVVADRYTYLPLIGIFVMMIWGSAELTRLLPGWALIATAGLLLLSCGLATRRQVQYWNSNTALFQHALTITTDTSNPHDIVGATLISLAHNNLAKALAAEGKLDQAISHYQQALIFPPSSAQEQDSSREPRVFQVQPDFAEIHDSLGRVLAQQGKLDLSLTHFFKALQLKPADPDLHYHAAMALDEQHRIPEALAAYREALRLRPDFPNALNNLAWILATHPESSVRDGAEAVHLAERACQLTHFKRASFLGTLAAACAEAGQYSDAATHAIKASQLAEAAGETDLAKRNLQLLELYRSGKPYRESPSTK
jgi:Flp pilus assembly protein TadD